MTSLPLPADRLLEHVQALRALARQLVADAATADDAVQDTVVTALRAPAPKGAVRAWLAAILRNIVRQNARAARRRTAAERRLDAEPAVASTAEVAGQLALQRQLLATVQELPEPLRQVVYLRFWRDLRPRAIAELLGIDVATAHSRLQRGLAQLRQRLDDDHGHRAWLTALLPLTSLRTHATASAAVATLLMNTKVLVAAAAAVLLVALLPWALSSPTAATPATPPTSGPVAASGNAPAGDPAAAVDRREVAGKPTPAPAAVPARSEFTGFVRDLDGRPVAGIDVHFEHDAASVMATTGGDGSFHMLVPSQSGCLDVQSDRWAAVRRGWLPAAAPAEPPVVVVAPARDYAGTVVDPEGVPAAGAVVTIVVAAQSVPTRAVADASVALPNDLKFATTDAQGHFALTHVAFVPGSQFTADLAPFKTAVETLPNASSTDVLLRLGTAVTDESYVYGIALDARSQPVADAVIAVGGAAVHSRADGRFTAPWSGGDGRGKTTVAPTWLRGVRADLGAAAVRLLPGSDQPGWRPDHPITLQFTAKPALLSGRVVDADNKPVAGARVLTPDLTYLGIVTFDWDGHQVSGECAVEGLAPGQDRLSVGTNADAEGRFTLTGLLPRSYTLFAIDPRTLAHTPPIAATPGDDVVLQVPSVAARAVAGRVVARDGTPLAAVRVVPGCGLPWTPPTRADDPWAGAPMMRFGAGHIDAAAAVITDAEGRFAFAALAIDNSFLSLDGEAVFAMAPFALPADGDLGHLEVKVDARCTFRLHLQQADEADAYSLVGADGEHVSLFVRVESAVMSMGKVQFVAGVAPEAHTRAGEPTVVLWRGDKEVRRAALKLPAGGVHDLRF